MADKTGIEWTDATWNPIVGCTHVSAGCDNCYAAREASGRLAHLPAYAGLAVDGKFTGKVNLLAERLDQPVRWAKPRMVFVNSMSDLFHPGVGVYFTARVFAIMLLTPRHVRVTC
jgi:protein gp37